MPNLHDRVSTEQIPPALAAVKTTFTHTEPDATDQQWDQVAETLEPSFPKVAEMMREAKPDVLAFTAFGRRSGRTTRSNGSTKGDQTPG